MLGKNDKILLINLHYLAVSFIHVNGLVQDCGNSIDNALELPQSYSKPSM